MFGGLITGELLIDGMGRKGALMVLPVPLVAGWLLIAFANNLSMLLIGRFVTGLGVGGASMTVPVSKFYLTICKLMSFIFSIAIIRIVVTIIVIIIIVNYHHLHHHAIAISIIIIVTNIVASLSSFSINATFIPREAASRAIPAPVIPPPIIKTSKFVDVKSLTIFSLLKYENGCIGKVKIYKKKLKKHYL